MPYSRRFDYAMNTRQSIALSLPGRLFVNGGNSINVWPNYFPIGICYHALKECGKVFLVSLLRGQMARYGGRPRGRVGQACTIVRDSGSATGFPMHGKLWRRRKVEILVIRGLERSGDVA